MPRLFTGLEIPSTLAESLSMLRGGIPGARWIDPENYHLTLRFIGDVDDALPMKSPRCSAGSGGAASSCGSTACRRSAAASRGRWWPRSRRRSR